MCKEIDVEHTRSLKGLMGPEVIHAQPYKDQPILTAPLKVLTNLLQDYSSRTTGPCYPHL